MINANVKPDRGAGDPDTTSTTLLERARADESEAWKLVNDKYRPAVYRWCRMDGVPPDQADELTQDILLSLFLELNTFRKEQPEDTFRGWLRRITRNRVIDWRRAAARRPPVARGGTSHQGQVYDAALQEDPETATEVNPQLALFCEISDRVRNRCDERTWQVFTHYVVDHYSPEETAEEFGVTVGYVHQVRARVLRRFRDELDLAGNSFEPLPSRDATYRAHPP